jgi:5-methylcytosine-specific restriction endonuclease McrA
VPTGMDLPDLPRLSNSGGPGTFQSSITARRSDLEFATGLTTEAWAYNGSPWCSILLATGSIRLSCLRLLKPRLTAENHQAVLARATNKTCKEVEALIAELAPQPDVAASVRRLPVRGAVDANNEEKPSPPSSSTPTLGMPERTAGPRHEERGEASTGLGGIVPSSTPSIAAHRPTVRASAPHRYRVQFTIGQDAFDKLQRVQALLRREIRDGDPGLIFEQALDLLLEKVEKAKLGTATRLRPQRVIRRATDKASRHIPPEVKRAVWLRDRGQCAFVAPTGLRCTEHTFLELHHIQPHALKGPATAANISLRCRRHNQYEAELVFGPPRAERLYQGDRLKGPKESMQTDG